MNELVTSGAKPLKNPKHERYARARSLLMPRLEAARSAGLETMNAANAARLERNPRIADRISYLSKPGEELLALKRRRIEEFLWLIHETDYGELWETYEEIGKDGVIRQKQRLKLMSEIPPDLRRVIEQVRYTESGRAQPVVYSKLQANQELRKLLGFGNTTEDKPGDELARMSDRELIEELAKKANDLGVNITLSYEPASTAGGS